MDQKFLPDFFIIGVQKSGTSTLHNILKNTDIVSLPKNKETHYFSYLINRKKSYSWYKEQFLIKKYHKLIGEVDPSYIYINGSAENIKKIVKNPKIIIMLRKPIERAFSHYSMSYRRGLEKYSFIEAVSNESKRLKNGKEFDMNNFSYLDRGNYSYQIARYQKIFKDSSFLFLKFDDLLDKKSKEELIISLFKFLDIKAEYKKNNFDAIHINKNKTFRFKSIQDILYGNSKFKNFLLKIIKDPLLRYKIKKYLEKINLKNTDYSEDDIYAGLPNRIIDWNNHEISKLEKTTNLNLKEWYIS